MPLWPDNQDISFNCNVTSLYIVFLFEIQHSNLYFISLAHFDNSICKKTPVRLGENLEVNSVLSFFFFNGFLKKLITL